MKKKISSSGDKIKSSYRKDESGNVLREIVIDKINNLSNSVLIIDEAHNISDNEYGEAVKKIIANSENLKVILLTATPMINLADEIVHLLNFIRPKDDQIQREMIFTAEKNFEMKIKPGGLEYLKDKARGYISFYRGSMPYTFADRVDMGKIPKGLLFTSVIKCSMDKFQEGIYNKILERSDDSLNKASIAVANFVFPGLNKNELEGYHSAEELNLVLSQLSSEDTRIKLCELINKKIFNSKIPKNNVNDLIMEGSNKNITGLILSLEYLKTFSTKYYEIVTNLNKLGAKTAFVYSNYVKAGGIELFAECLKVNGYLEYNKEELYDIKPNTIDTISGLTFEEFEKNKMKGFLPATFLLVTGGGDEEDVSEENQKIIQEVFNNPSNSDSSSLKLILGSRVMNEGVTLKNVSQVHILDPFFNIPKMEQVIGRAIRMCVHKDVITKENLFPKVQVFRYVVSTGNTLSSDEILYQKAELKYLVVKQVERALKETAIDCPLLLHANMFPEDLEKYSKCVEPTLENVSAGKTICPALCDFIRCDLKCDGTKLNEKYWNEKANSYRDLKSEEISYGTFNDNLAKYEITLIKNKIRDLYRFKHIYTYEEMAGLIKKSFLAHQANLFNDYFLDQALEDLMPKTENEFNNFADTIFDKYNRTGYLIKRESYYIFQPFDENEDVPMYYRKTFNINNSNKVIFDNFITKTFGDKVKNLTETNIETEIEKTGYDFDSTMEYYEDREENFIVGIIDKNTSKMTNYETGEIMEEFFKIRDKLKKDAKLKRGTGIPTFKGGICTTGKNKEQLQKILSKIKPTPIESQPNKVSKESLCSLLRHRLEYWEKYSTTSDGNKITWLVVPINHPKYPFPYNLEDRIKYKLKELNKIAGVKVEHKVTKIKDELPKYNIKLDNTKLWDGLSKQIKELGFNKEDDWQIIIE